MDAKIFIAPLANKEEKLQDIADYLDKLKDELADVLDEYEGDGAEDEKIDDLTDALDALTDAYELISDIVADEI